MAISVFIITKNEEKRIRDAILSVKDIADEILVVDSGSEDETCQIAKDLGAKVIFNEWPGYGQQKFFAEKRCQNDWILNIDADERVTKELAQEIKNLDLSESHGFWVNICEIPHFTDKVRFFTRKKLYLRFYNRKFCSYRQNMVHDSVVAKDKSKLLKLKNLIIHKSLMNYRHEVEKINSYSTNLAINAYEQSKKTNNLAILLSPFLAFFKHYFLRRHFLYGVDGFVASFIYAFSRLLKYAKIKEIYRLNEKK